MSEAAVKTRAGVRRILTTYLSDLRMEIGRTDRFEYRRWLHLEEDQLRGILAKLERAGPAAPWTEEADEAFA